VYGAPSSSYGAPKAPASSYDAPSSSYGAPNIPSSSYGAPSSSYGAPKTPSNSYGTPSSSYGVPDNSYSAPSTSYGAPKAPSSSYGLPSSSHGVPTTSFGAPSSSFDSLSSSYGAPVSSYGAPSSSYGAPSVSDSYGAPSNSYETVVKFDDSKVDASNKQSVSSATKNPASPFEETANQKKPTNEDQHISASYKGDESTQYMSSQINQYVRSPSQVSSSSNDNLRPSYYGHITETFGDKIRQRESFPFTDTAYSDRQDNAATVPLQNRGHVKFPDAQSEFSQSIKQWEASPVHKPGSSTAEVKQR
jgi:hypothetical protein